MRRRRHLGAVRALSTATHDQVEDERRRAVRALLRHPLLTPATPDPDAFVLARRHAAWLGEWFAREAGWVLVAEASVVRLKKTTGDWADPHRPAATLGGGRAPFTRRRYVLLCLALAALERAEPQVTLGRLVDHVVVLAADPALVDAGVRFTMADREQRADLAAVARLLLEAGALAHVAGDERSFVDATGDVLYDVDRAVLSALLVVRRGPSMVDDPGTTPARIAAVSADAAPDTDDARNRWTRHRLARRLLDDPVVYLDDLTDDERGYLATQRGPLTARLARGTGMVPEARAEGLAMIDPTGEAGDTGLPEEGTDGHATLLVAERLAEHLRARPGTPLPLGDLHAHVRDLAAQHRTHWRRATREPGAEVDLTAGALARLVALHLVHLTDAGDPVPRPALARFAYEPARLSTPESPA